MRRLISTFMLAAVTLGVSAAPSYADGFLSPFIGVNFGGDLTENSTTYGGAPSLPRSASASA